MDLHICVQVTTIDIKYCQLGMSKETKEDQIPVAGKQGEMRGQKKEKKGKKDKKTEASKQGLGAPDVASFSLFGGKTDAQLDDVFSKGVGRANYM